MSTKTKTTAAAAIAALALPSAAFAGDGHHGKGKGHAKHGEGVEQRAKSQGKSEGGKHKGWSKHKRGAVVLAGVDVTGLTVTDGKLAGPITLDPVTANRKARTLLDLTKEEIRGEDTVQVGTAGDAVIVKYDGLTATDALLPTDVVKVQGKFDRKTGELDIKKLIVKRASTTETPEQD